MKKKITISCWILLILLIIYLLFQLTKLRNFQLFGGLTSRVETDEKVIALTFDDAPTIYSDEILEMLKEKNIKATFYVIGKNMEEFPEETKRIVAEGHELGNHSYSHKRFVLKSYSFIDEEIQKTNSLIRTVGYKGEITFRPPTGKKFILLPWYLKQHNIKTIMWDVEPDTYVPGDRDAIIQYTLQNINPGSIILIHPFCGEVCEADRAALPVIIDELINDGYTFMTVGELLQTQ